MTKYRDSDRCLLYMYNSIYIYRYGKSAPRDEIVMRSFGKPNQQWKIASSLWFRLPEVSTNSRRRRSVAISILAQSWYVLTLYMALLSSRPLTTRGWWPICSTSCRAAYGSCGFLPIAENNMFVGDCYACSRSRKKFDPNLEHSICQNPINYSMFWTKRF